jgi:hypothetical protein
MVPEEINTFSIYLISEITMEDFVKETLINRMFLSAL